MRATATDRRIHVEASRNGQCVQLTVRDHGPGIRAAARGRSGSQPFSKSAQESAETAPGVGLGLALCRRLARQLGGRLEIAATPGGGATVTLLLPVVAYVVSLCETTIPLAERDGLHCPALCRRAVAVYLAVQPATSRSDRGSASRLTSAPASCILHPR